MTPKLQWLISCGEDQLGDTAATQINIDCYWGTGLYSNYSGQFKAATLGAADDFKVVIAIPCTQYSQECAEKFQEFLEKIKKEGKKLKEPLEEMNV